MLPALSYFIYDTPIGKITLFAQKTTILGVHFGAVKKSNPQFPLMATEQETLLLQKAARQLQEYFTGTRTSFTLPLAPLGTPFQMQVWNTLLAIPYGETRSYKEIALAINKPSASRAVGMAIHKNPIPIIIPCHRVIGTNGSLVGFSAGLPIKEQLLKLEGHPER
jgi:methylated-DNA-[protein]-cysteine S-methyltransferase